MKIFESQPGRKKALPNRGRGYRLSGASRPKPPFDWSQVIRSAVWLVGVLGAASLFYLTYVYVHKQVLENLKINTVVIEGDREYGPKSEVRKVIVSLSDNHFFDLKIDDLQKRLINIPWVKSASLRKEWPDQLVINIKEYRPVARWVDTNRKKWLLSNDGVIFLNNAYDRTQMPVLSGSDEHRLKVIRHYKTLSTQLISTQIEIEKISFNVRHEWSVHLSNDIEVKYLDKDTKKVMRRIILALNVLGDSQISNVDLIDLRYEHGFAVRWKEDKHV